MRRKPYIPRIQENPQCHPCLLPPPTWETDTRASMKRTDFYDPSGTAHRYDSSFANRGGWCRSIDGPGPRPFAAASTLQGDRPPHEQKIIPARDRFLERVPTFRD